MRKGTESLANLLEQLRKLDLTDQTACQSFSTELSQYLKDKNIHLDKQEQSVLREENETQISSSDPSEDLKKLIREELGNYYVADNGILTKLEQIAEKFSEDTPHRKVVRFFKEALVACKEETRVEFGDRNELFERFIDRLNALRFILFVTLEKSLLESPHFNVAFRAFSNLFEQIGEFDDKQAILDFSKKLHNSPWHNCVYRCVQEDANDSRKSFDERDKNSPIINFERGVEKLQVMLSIIFSEVNSQEQKNYSLILQQALSGESFGIAFKRKLLLYVESYISDESLKKILLTEKPQLKMIDTLKLFLAVDSLKGVVIKLQDNYQQLFNIKDKDDCCSFLNSSILYADHGVQGIQEKIAEAIQFSKHPMVEFTAKELTKTLSNLKKKIRRKKNHDFTDLPRPHFFTPDYSNPVRSENMKFFAEGAQQEIAELIFKLEKEAERLEGCCFYLTKPTGESGYFLAKEDNQQWELIYVDCEKQKKNIKIDDVNGLQRILNNKTPEQLTELDKRNIQLVITKYHNSNFKERNQKANILKDYIIKFQQETNLMKFVNDQMLKNKQATLLDDIKKIKNNKKLAQHREKCFGGKYLIRIGLFKLNFLRKTRTQRNVEKALKKAQRNIKAVFALNTRRSH